MNMPQFVALSVVGSMAFFVWLLVHFDATKDKRQARREAQRLVKAEKRDRRYRELGKQTRKAAGSTKGAAKGSGVWISKHSRHPIILILITFALLVGGYYVMSPYQNCVREKDQQAKQEGWYSETSRSMARVMCTKYRKW